MLCASRDDLDAHGTPQSFDDLAFHSCLQYRSNPGSPIYGMPILDVDKAKNAIVIKRGQGTGFAGIQNALFFADNCRMLYGDGQEMAAQLIQEVKGL